MYSISSDTIIQKIPMEPDPVTGNRLFRIRKNDSANYYLQSEFLQPHRKDYYFLAFVTKGGSRVWVDMRSYILKPQTVYFTTPHQINLKEEVVPMSGYTIAFTPAFLALDDSGFLESLPIIGNLHNGHELNLSPEDAVFIEGMMEKMNAEYGVQGTWQHQMLLAYMKVLLIYMSRLYTEQFDTIAGTPDRLLLKRFLAQIDESFGSLHEVADYAALLHISPGHLGDVIKAQSGKSAITHIHERLLLEARRYLVHSELAVKEIAYELGFEDASYFNRFFKRMSGQTPVAYKTQIRKMYH
jgi:AraC family transcriptional activator of pobA